MTQEELYNRLKPHVNSELDGFYEEKLEGANIRAIMGIFDNYMIDIIKQYAESFAEKEVQKILHMIKFKK